MTRLLVQIAYPLGKLGRVRHGGREEHHLDGRWQEDYTLLPHDPALAILHVVDLIEDNPGHLLDHLGPPVEHCPEDLRGHDEASRVRLQRDIAGHQSDIGELLAELPVLLVAQGLERGGVYDPLLVPERHGDGVLGNGGLPRRGVGGDEHRLVALEAGDGDALEGVELERVGLGHLAMEGRARERPVHRLVLGRGVALGHRHLVDARPRQVPPLRRRVRRRRRRRMLPRDGGGVLALRRLPLARVLHLLHPPPLPPPQARASYRGEEESIRARIRVERGGASPRFGGGGGGGEEARWRRQRRRRGEVSNGSRLLPPLHLNGLDNGPRPM